MRFRGLLLFLAHGLDPVIHGKRHSSYSVIVHRRIAVNSKKVLIFKFDNGIVIYNLNEKTLTVFSIESDVSHIFLLEFGLQSGGEYSHS